MIKIERFQDVDQIWRSSGLIMHNIEGALFGFGLKKL